MALSQFSFGKINEYKLKGEQLPYPGGWDADNNLITEQLFEKGKLINGKEIDTINCSKIEVNFLLDENIWGTNFKWNKIYLTHQLQEFAYLYKQTKFEITYKEDEDDCKLIYHFKNGLKDRIDRLGLYPITVSTLLTKREKQFLLSRNVVLCRTLIQDKFYLDHLGVSETRKEKILNEISQLCDFIK